MKRSPFSKEIYIRLTDDETVLICTSKYGRLLSKETKFPLHRQSVREVHAEIAAHGPQDGRVLSRTDRGILFLNQTLQAKTAN